MKKTGSIIGILVLVFSISVFSNESKVGYKGFNLGQSRQAVTSFIKDKFTRISYSINKDMRIETGDMVYTDLFFDHLDMVYYIQVEIKSGEVSKVKQRLVETYGQPNDFSGKEFNRENKSHLTSRWLIDKRYKIALWESEYCRSSRLNPCILYVEYMDLKMKDAKGKHEQKVKLEEQRKKDGKTYDGF